MAAKSIRNREEYWRARTARKQHRCEDYVCEHRIEPGERYIELKLPPGGDMGYTSWSLMRICVTCGCRYHRHIVEQLGLVEPALNGATS